MIPLGQKKLHGYRIVDFVTQARVMPLLEDLREGGEKFKTIISEMVEAVITVLTPEIIDSSCEEAAGENNNISREVLAQKSPVNLPFDAARLDFLASLDFKSMMSAANEEGSFLLRIEEQEDLLFGFLCCLQKCLQKYIS